MSTAAHDASLKTSASRPSMLPHSLSLGHLPGPNFSSLPSGQRSVPASDAFARVANGERTPTTSEGVRTPGAVGERVRRDSFEPWTFENDNGPPERMMEVARRNTVQFDVIPKDIGTVGGGRSSLTDYRRSSIAKVETTSPTNPRPGLNRAPGSRDGMTSTNAGGGVSRKSMGMGAPAQVGGLPFNISQTIPESEAVDYDDMPGMIGMDKARAASVSFDMQGRVNGSAASSRRASQQGLVNFPSSGVDHDSLISGMGSMTFNDLSKRRLTEGVLPGLRSNSGIMAHRQSLPGPYLRSGNTDALGGYYGGNGSSFMSPEQEPANYIGADTGYGAMPQASANDYRRNSHSPTMNPSASLGNLRRSQSAWQIHDAFNNGGVAPSRQPSLSYGAGLTGNTASYMQNPFGNGAQNGYGDTTSPSMTAMDLPTNLAVNGLFGGSSLLAQQQLLNEMRRQSLARQAMDLNQLGLMNPFALGYGGGGGVQQSVPQNVVGMNNVYPTTTAQGVGRQSFESNRGSIRSPILEEFRANKHRRWELRDMLGHIVEFAGDQLGSRHIQSKLDTATTDEKEMVFVEIYPNVLQLSMDVFANYVVQKFFEQGNQSQKAQLADALRGHVLQLSLQMYGCRVVQKALEHVLVDQQQALVKELEGDVIYCAKDQNANHVLQRSLELVDAKTNSFITQAFMGQAFSLATHGYGCRVLQRVFEHMPSVQSRPLLDELHRYSHNLMNDQYGNYVAQWMITDGQVEDSILMISKVKGQTLQLSKHKYASNVVEKAVLKGTTEDLHFMIDELLTSRDDGASTIGIMLKDAFANFPLQKFLLMAKEPQRSVLFKETASQLVHMRKYSINYGKYLVAIEKLVTTELGPLVEDVSVATEGPAPESA